MMPIGKATTAVVVTNGILLPGIRPGTIPTILGTTHGITMIPGTTITTMAIGDGVAIMAAGTIVHIIMVV